MMDLARVVVVVDAAVALMKKKNRLSKNGVAAAVEVAKQRENQTNTPGTLVADCCCQDDYARIGCAGTSTTME
jgi:hypothetical protein